MSGSTSPLDRWFGWYLFTKQRSVYRDLTECKISGVYKDLYDACRHITVFALIIHHNKIRDTFVHVFQSVDTQTFHGNIVNTFSY